MAPKRSMKVAKSPVAKKPKVRDTLTPKINKVANALRNNDYFVPDMLMETRELLATCGESAFQTVAEERHQFQSRMIEMIEQALNGIRGKLQTALDEQVHFASNTDNVKKQHETDLAVAQQAVEAKKDEIAGKTERKNKDTDAHHEATDVRMKAADAAEKAETAKERTEAEKENALAIYNECFVPLRDDPTVAGADRLLKRLEKQMEGMEVVDESLQKAAPNALVKQIADRGAFDAMALTSLDKIFKKFDADATNTIENSEVLKAQAHKAKDDAEAAEELAEATKKASQEALAAAKDELKKLNQTVKEHEKALKGHDKRVSEIESDKSKAEAELEGFDAFVLEPFNFLKDRAAEKPEEEEAGEGNLDGAAEDAGMEDADAAAAAPAEEEEVAAEE